MTDKINDLLRRVEAFKPKVDSEIEEFRIRMLGRKGEMYDLFEELKKVAPELKKEPGQKPKKQNKIPPLQKKGNIQFNAVPIKN